jgi:hypothetical protein
MHKSTFPPKALNHFNIQIFISTFLFFFVSFLLFSCGKGESDDAIIEAPMEEEPEKMGYDYPEGKIYFSLPPMDLSGAAYYEPMGRMGVFPQDHGGFIHFEYGVDKPKTPIFAMADGVITELGKPGDDYFMVVRYSTTISTRMGHVGRFAEFITNQTGPILDGMQRNTEITVKSGDTIGYISSYSALDIGVHDLEVADSKSFCYPELAYFENLYAADIFDYYKVQNPVRNEFLDKNLRKTEPYGGKNDYDVKGTISGNWYLKEPITDKDPAINYLAIGYDHLYAHRIAILDGLPRFNTDEIDTHSFTWIKNNTPKPEVVNLTYGMVKYELITNRHGYTTNTDGSYELIPIDDAEDQMQLPRGVLILQMLDTETMQIEYYSEKSAEEVDGFSEKRRVYVRKPDY